MPNRSDPGAMSARMEPLESRTLLSASVVISEFVATNTHTRPKGL